MVVTLLSGCNETEDIPNTTITVYDSSGVVYIPPAGSVKPYDTAMPGRVATFAETMMGVPYKYASTDPATGFDCSGFITYVFTHFGLTVPRSSVDFTNVGREIDKDSAMRGDLILFTGTDTSQHEVGHMGIVTANSADSLYFIHATSGKQYGVVVTPLNSYYTNRFVKVIRVFDNTGKLAL